MIVFICFWNLIDLFKNIFKKYMTKSSSQICTFRFDVEKLSEVVESIVILLLYLETEISSCTVFHTDLTLLPYIIIFELYNKILN